ncbi:mitochondrial resolvase Ydc2 [Xylariaceae sp. FL0594]|nr:mitochondrial resolvase Ydc2 [Xylariaceae sp. FL0594]
MKKAVRRTSAAIASRIAKPQSPPPPQQQQPQLQQLHHLRSEQLKRLSFLCGLPITGRKDELAARLQAAASTSTSTSSPQSQTTIPTSSNPPGAARPVVLSIDLGIKNLAYSLLTPAVPPGSASTSQSGSRGSESEIEHQDAYKTYTDPPAIHLHAWKRLSFLESNPNPNTPTTTTTTTTDDTSSSSSSAFTPRALALTTNAFLRRTVLALRPRPTHILIERQRWRSGGGAAVQEWTVRVNTLEAMLHSSLRTLMDCGVWEGEVLSVRPERVGQFFLSSSSDSDSEDKGKSTRKTKSADTKRAKIALLSRWLDHNQPPQDPGPEDKSPKNSIPSTTSTMIIQPATQEARDTLDAYRSATTSCGDSRPKSKSKTNAQTQEESEAIPTEITTTTTLISNPNPKEDNNNNNKNKNKDKKLDDLTDSLMQGMVWLRWRANTALLASDGGVETLLRLRVPTTSATTT